MYKRRDCKEWCKGQKARHAREEEGKINRINTETETWKYINRYGRKRKKREGVDKRIGSKKWKTQFMELLGGQEMRGTEDRWVG